jgi:hypothetical protein
MNERDRRIDKPGILPESVLAHARGCDECVIIDSDAAPDGRRLVRADLCPEGERLLSEDRESRTR